MVQAGQSDETGAGILLQDARRTGMLRSRPSRRRTAGGLDIPGSQALGSSRSFLGILSFLALALILGGADVAADERLPGDYLSSYRAAAEKGDPKAQYYLGLRYEKGITGTPDHRTAARWYGEAAANGHREAGFRLGLFYQHGLGVGRDLQRAADWYRAAAEAGLPEAQFNLAYLMERGLGVDVDGQAAIAWYRRAALQGMTEAYRALAMLYAGGRVVGRDDAKALFWLSLLGSDEGNQVKEIERLIRERSDAGTLAAAEDMRRQWNAR